MLSVALSLTPPKSEAAGRYPAPLFRGARTFLVSLAQAAAARSPGERLYGLLRPGQQERQQLGAAFAVDDAVDQVGPEAALEGDHGLLLVGHVIAEPFERQQESGIGPVRVHQVTRRAWECQPPLCQFPPGKQLAGVLLAGGG